MCRHLCHQEEGHSFVPLRTSSRSPCLISRAYHAPGCEIIVIVGKASNSMIWRVCAVKDEQENFQAQSVPYLRCLCATTHHHLTLYTGLRSESVKTVFKTRKDRRYLNGLTSQFEPGGCQTNPVLQFKHQDWIFKCTGMLVMVSGSLAFILLASPPVYWDYSGN